jgi:hypothetical protein
MTVVYKDGKKIKELFGDKPAEFDVCPVASAYFMTNSYMHVSPHRHI